MVVRTGNEPGISGFIYSPTLSSGVHSVTETLQSGSLSKDVLGSWTATGRNAFFFSPCLCVTTLVLLTAFSLIELIGLKFLAKTLPKFMKRSLMVDVRAQKVFAKLPIAFLTESILRELSLEKHNLGKYAAKFF